MAKASCACGQTFDAPPGDAACPGCGAVVTVAEAKIRLTCACGKALAAPPKLAGKRVLCPKCGEFVQVPLPEPEIDFAPAPAPSPSPDPAPALPSPRATEFRKPAPGVRARVAAAPPPTNDGWRKYGRWGLAAALIPLILSVFTPDDSPIQRLQRMIERDEALAKTLGNLEEKSKEEILVALPEQRIEGALHSRHTGAHWLYALLSAGAFWGLILLLYPLGKATSKQIWFAGLFVGTIGILLLLGLQWTAMYTQGTWIRGRGIIVILFYIIKFIGFSYAAADDPSNGFFLSMLGFTFGVGFCEELCKALPLLWHYKKTQSASAALDVRGAVVWGLAAGIGFGVSEGITYSSDYYNGISTGGIYVVRFVSCVALHAIWSATNALFLWKNQADFDGIGEWYGWFIPLFKTLGLSMVLHGLYDTLLKREMEVGALLAAVASFALFFWLYERTVREEARFAPAAAGAA
ncbi:MAG TPA: PrsW family glutamic-type intramembrane protease [Planctomycetota bacterium]|jgi:RsiW-degrading membrane proteinase PrsW (M82 family)|nr:PrsW family glutamic-type intramembrane protease [Planctomycetota bacterium]